MLGEKVEAPRVGDPIRFKLVLPEGAPAPKSISVPAGMDLSEQGWQLGPLRADKQGGLFFTGRAAKPGALTLPSLALVGEKDGGQGPVARTNPRTVRVVSAIAADDPEPEKPANVRPPARLPYPWWVGALLGGLAVILFAALAYWAWKFLKGRQVKAVPLPELPPKPEDEEAIAALDALLAQSLPAQGKHKPHYFRASEILKRYLGRRYDFDAPEKTSGEIVLHLEDHKLVSEKLIDQVESLFERMDRVKFADHVPGADEGAKLVKEIRELVIVTKRMPIVASPISGTPSAEPKVSLR